jgi:hypothetical protein
MANKYLDISYTTAPESMSEADGSALTVTNDVRVLYDNATANQQIILALQRAIEKLAALGY